MSVTGTSLLRRTARFVLRPGMKTVICWPGLKPSARFQSRGSMRTPSLFSGMPARGSARRRPVSVRPSRFVK